MKGTVKLQLFDKEGKVVKQVEDHNMLTNFIRDFFTYDMVGREQMLNLESTMNAVENQLHKFFGTIQVFGDTLSNDPDDYFANGQKVVGIATFNNAYSGEVDVYGNYNGVESGWVNDSTFKYVFDFPTSKSNGTIKALGLSPISANGHGFGLENCDEKSLFDSNVTSGTHAHEMMYRFGSNSQMPVWNYNYYAENGSIGGIVGIPLKNCIAVIMDSYAVFSTFSSAKYFGKTSKLTISKFPWFFEKVSFHRLGTRVGSNSNKTESLETLVELELKNPLNTSSRNYGFFNYANGKIYALFKNAENWTANEELLMSVYDIEKDEQSTIKIRNTTGKTIKLSACDSIVYYSCIGSRFTEFCNGEYILVRTTENLFYSINITDQSDVKTFTSVGGNPVTHITYSTAYAMFGVDDCVYISDGIGIAKNPTIYSDITIFNLKTGIVQYIKSSRVIQTLFTTCSLYFPIMGKKGFMFRQYLNGSYSKSDWCPFEYASLAGLCLTTKMNLDEPLVKTADFTMKISYTIQCEPMG